MLTFASRGIVTREGSVKLANGVVACSTYGPTDSECYWELEEPLEKAKGQWGLKESIF